tara:strand:- start:6460 stop:6783 length:324 start_codon:yes stop_codon:yes gene_type:complete
MNWFSNALNFMSTLGVALGGKKGSVGDFSSDLMKLPGYSAVANENFDSKNYSIQGTTAAVDNTKLLSTYRTLLLKEFNSTQQSLMSLQDDAKAKKFFASLTKPNIRT